MLDLNHPDTKKTFEACSLIDEMSKSYPALFESDGDTLSSLHGGFRLKLGRLGVLADEILEPEGNKVANESIMLLYKALTGQIELTHKDEVKIKLLIGKLNESFYCWCI